MTHPGRATHLAARVLLLCLGVLAAGCIRGGDDAADSGPIATQRLVERDVEAPEIFQTTERGLWDGRPSLGGVWVAHPDTQDPERVVIRNEDTGRFVIGALFRRDRDAAGPALQVSSDAAEALGMRAGEPATLNVTALRREDPAVETPRPATEDTPAAIVEPAPVAPPPQPSTLDRPFIQIGIFSQESNANDTAEAFRDIGVAPSVERQTSSGNTFYRVIVGPAANETERDALLAKVKEMGFSDAYFIGQ
ncbi:Sporulation related domain-containing protein [Palleronia marisminoris]|uniref:Sporulation related domain protein n=1 Tax=Palleronia marisminoris TaxID=315423 RepID=A0A1Y5SA44_9RHOB|nr:SPOR domain-containing protein [Palleronia marisminoris]SFG69666.1 Sporulation related domain-containing protein [Palleronia marisminoris]SLN35698.1 Sporulation related domain protein [Palleronia marisminoris]